MKKIVFLALLVLLILPTEVVQAVEPSNFVPCNGTDCSACDFVTMVNTIIKWFFGIVFMIFAVLMARAGIGLVTSGGSQSALESAKSTFQNAIIGLLIVMAGWLIVDTLMRGLVKGDGDLGATFNGFGPWSEVQCQVQVRPVAWPGDPMDVSPSAPAVPPAPLPAGSVTGCTGAACVPMPASICTPSNRTNCNGSPEMIARLEAFHAAAGVPGARVTEGMPPTVPHQSVCHTQGTCVDYGKAGGMTGAEVARAADAARASGLRPVYEVKTQAEKNTLVAGGANANDILVISKITAPHFSIYGY